MDDKKCDKRNDINSESAASPPEESAPEAEHYIFVAYFRHAKSGKIIRRANGRPFRIKVKPGRSRRTPQEDPPK